MRNCLRCKLSKPDLHFRYGRNQCKKCEAKIAYENTKKRLAGDPIARKAYNQSKERRHKKKGVEVDSLLKSESFMYEALRIVRNCEFCKIAFDYTAGHSNQSPSLDRLDPRKGYTEDNVALLCNECNRRKRDWTPDEMIRMAEWIRQKLG